jgi:hypothetical protein
MNQFSEFLELMKKGLEEGREETNRKLLALAMHNSNPSSLIEPISIIFIIIKITFYTNRWETKLC